jgi:hypothetical protein
MVCSVIFVLDRFGGSLGAQLEDAQKSARHRDSGAAELCDRRRYNPEKVASFFAT